MSFASRPTRAGLARTLRNLVVTMALGGLWHGASWTFVVWGLYHGALLAGHALHARTGRVVHPLLARAATLLAVLVGWVFFRAASLAEAGRLLGSMFGLRTAEGGYALLVAPTALIAAAAGAALALAAPNTWQLRFPRSPAAAVALALLMLACMLQFAQPSPFVYFQF